MKLPSKRHRNSGFTLLETLLALACAAIVLGAFYALTIQSSRSLQSAKQTYELSEVARAMLDEYIVTYPMMESKGNYGARWDWYVDERAYVPDHQTSQDHHFEFVEVTVTVSRKDLPNRYSLSRAIALRGGV